MFDQEDISSQNLSLCNPECLGGLVSHVLTLESTRAEQKQDLRAEAAPGLSCPSFVQQGAGTRSRVSWLSALEDSSGLCLNIHFVSLDCKHSEGQGFEMRIFFFQGFLGKKNFRQVFMAKRFLILVSFTKSQK